MQAGPAPQLSFQYDFVYAGLQSSPSMQPMVLDAMNAAGLGLAVNWQVCQCNIDNDYNNVLQVWCAWPAPCLLVPAFQLRCWLPLLWYVSHFVPCLGLLPAYSSSCITAPGCPYCGMCHTLCPALWSVQTPAGLLGTRLHSALL